MKPGGTILEVVSINGIAINIASVAPLTVSFIILFKYIYINFVVFLLLLLKLTLSKVLKNKISNILGGDAPSGILKGVGIAVNFQDATLDENIFS